MAARAGGHGGGCELPNAFEIEKDRFFFASQDVMPQDTPRTHFFAIDKDKDFQYEAFMHDFGPLNLASVYRYCRRVQEKLNNPRLNGKQIVHVSSNIPAKRANAACLAALYRVIVLKMPAKAAVAPFQGVKPPFMPFRDATAMPVCSYHLTIEDCCAGLEKAMELGWFNYEKFELEAYDNLDHADYCGLNWIIPHKFMAFAGPGSRPPAFVPEHYVPIFKKHCINLVVRLNSQEYDSARFTDRGLRHMELFFKDGSCPSMDIMTKFLEAAEAEKGGIAVHCKAGLGRTCTLIGLYAMKHFKFPARAFIGWARICRPGSVLGPQQQFLCNMQLEMFAAGAAGAGGVGMPGQQARSLPSSPLGGARPHSLSEDLERYEDKGQGERLIAAKQQGGGVGLRGIMLRSRSCSSVSPGSPAAANGQGASPLAGKVLQGPAGQWPSSSLQQKRPPGVPGSPTGHHQHALKLPPAMLFKQESSKVMDIKIR
eukprot:TRINITY_DN122063_c0_g1_i1.p1 TRINITY_DN122063_c0_g1~~TRINITY_DN122063_c0_g1_i1.p1  ORF type:complete len:483 (+),score=126.71 TRINITY_DN122063_c0_g1_i1:215-1663(+)